MVKTIRVMLIPNNKQKTKLFQYANTARFAYNWALGKEQKNYKNGGKFISDGDLRKEFTQLKKTNDYFWLNNVSNNVTKQAIKDACEAYRNFFKGYTKFPRFKSKKHSVPKFYQDNLKIKFTDTHIKVEGFANSKKKNRQKLNWIRLAEHGRIPTDCKYYNPRIKYDGLNWWITVGVDCKPTNNILKTNGIGIDLGIKDLAICSDGNKYKNINKTEKIKKLEKRKRRLQRSISKKYELNKKGGRYCKTSNIIKSEKELLKLNRRLTNIRHNYIHQTTSEIIQRKPSYITIEDLNVKGMMKNKHISKSVQQQCLYEVARQLKYKCSWNGIELRQVSRWYPSSKTCHECGYINKELKWYHRTYKCPICGYVEDRDYNASLNLRDMNEYKIIV